MKKFILIAAIAVIVISGCSLVTAITNPIVGTWKSSLLGIDTTTYVFNSDNSRTETTTVLGVGTTTIGTWSSDSTILTRATSGSADVTDFFSFNSDKSTMTLAPTGGGLSVTLTRQ